MSPLPPPLNKKCKYCREQLVYSRLPFGTDPNFKKPGLVTTLCPNCDKIHFPKEPAQ